MDCMCIIRLHLLEKCFRKTTAVELLDACYSILGEFRLEGRNYSYDNVELIMDFYYNEYIYRYETILTNSDAIGSKAFLPIRKYTKRNITKQN